MVRQKWWWWLPADGRAARRRERGGARPFVRACGVAICDAGRCSAARGRCVARARAPRAHECRPESGAVFKLCVRARAVSLAQVRAVRNECSTPRFAVRTQPVRTCASRKARAQRESATGFVEIRPDRSVAVARLRRAPGRVADACSGCQSVRKSTYFGHISCAFVASFTAASTSDAKRRAAERQLALS